MTFRGKIKNIAFRLTREAYLDFKRLCRMVLIYFRYLSRFYGIIFDRKEILIIEVEYGGLGDHLFYSHLPRLAKESGKYDAVYFSNVSPFRRLAHKEIIWGYNPYLDGFVNWFGKTYRNLLINTKKTSEGSPEKRNILDDIMVAYGLDDGNRFHNPEIYYRPNEKLEFKDKVIFDPNFVTPLYETSSIYEDVKAYFSVNNINVDLQFKPNKSAGAILNESKYIVDDSFEEFCDIVSSCKELYCFASGTAVLAAALGKKVNVFYVDAVDPKFLFSREHNYIKI